MYIGPLWEGRFKSVIITSSDILLHVTRYIHLNPVTACLVDDPVLWQGSSYKEYIISGMNEGICSFRDTIEMKPDTYKKFVEERADYQRELARIKDVIFENPISTS